jgi:hydroxymethylpyrimidine pyrophosphatase-like HAD family hydrolase
MPADLVDACTPALANQRMIATGLARIEGTRQFHGRYLQADLVISMRVHSMSPSIGLGVPMIPVIQAVSGKGRTLAAYYRRHGTDLDRVALVRNDINDMPAREIDGFPVAVADAHPLVKRSAKHVLRTRGGEGAAREIAEDLFGLTRVRRRGGGDRKS